jgi:hypothetical protein
MGSPTPSNRKISPKPGCGKCGMVFGRIVRGEANPKMNSTEGIDPDGVARSRSKHLATGKCTQARGVKIIARVRPYFNAHEGRAG